MATGGTANYGVLLGNVCASKDYFFIVTNFIIYLFLNIAIVEFLLLELLIRDYQNFKRLQGLLEKNKLLFHFINEMKLIFPGAGG